MQLYKELLMDHYKHPRNYGTLDNPDFSLQEYNPSCGDSVSFQGNIKNNTLLEVRFSGKGCVISQATASLLSEYSKGKPIDEILALTKDNVLHLIHMELGPTRLKCALLPLQALQEGIIHYKEKLRA